MDRLLKQILLFALALGLIVYGLKKAGEARGVRPADPPPRTQPDRKAAQAADIALNLERARSEMDRISAYLYRDKQRLFKRIPRDSLVIYGAQLTELGRKINLMEEQLEKMGIDPQRGMRR